MASWLRTIGVWPLLGVAFTGSLLLALGAPPDGMPVLIWLGFAPLVLVLRVVDPLRARQAFVLGWVGGLCTGLVGFPWIAETLERFGQFPWWLAQLGLLTFAAWTAIPFGLWAWGVVAGPRLGWKAIAWPAVLWVAITAWWPALFPFTPTLGFAQMPAWMQAAELGGVPLVEMQVVVVGVLLADGLLATSARARWCRIVAAAAIVSASYGLGAWRMAVLDAEAAAAPKVRFGLVQPNVPLLYAHVDDKMNRLRGQSRLAQDEGAQVVVWPEAGAFPFAADRPVRRDFFDRRRRVLLLHDLPTIFGVATHAPGNPYEYNTVLAFDEHGKTTGSFDKVNLVPFGEYVPVVDPEWARELVPAMAHNNAGEGAVRFEIDPPTTRESYATEPFGAGPLICFEDILADFSREVAGVPEGIDVFVNVTIDTWFGDTAEPWEHLGLAQFRSVEHRIPMVRAVAAGTSSYVDLTGRLAASLPVRAPTAEHMVPAERLVVDVPMSRNTARDPTPYARGGWLLQWWCILVGVAGAGMPLARSVRKKYRARARDPSDE